MSTIDTSGIDETKPVAIEPQTGSIRDNFAEIKTQFGNASSDIDALITADAALGTIKTQDSNNVSITGGNITGITDLAIADGGTGQGTAQAAIDALTQVSAATNEHILTKDTTSGNAEWKVNAGVTSGISSITGTVAASVLTVGLVADTLYFRSATLTDGAPVSRTFSTLSLVVPSGATLGTINAVQSRLILLAIDNAGTIELAIVNQSGSVNLDEEGVISTTAISATADLDTVIYSTTARTNVAYRVVGFIDSTQATAGTWATAPSTLQGAGGNALASMSSLGYGQTWQLVTRTSGTTYYNTTGKPITLNLQLSASSNTTLTINGLGMGSLITDAGVLAAVTYIIPPGSTYSQTIAGGTVAARELR